MIKKFITIFLTGVLLISNITCGFGTSNGVTEYPGQLKAADFIVEAIKSNNADIIESMFNIESQNGIESLKQKIESLMSVIDGEILNYTSSGSYQKDNVDLGYKYSEVGFNITINTQKNKYLLNVGWITKCSSNSEKVGIEHLGLSQLDENERRVDFWETISLPYKRSVKYKKVLDLLRDPGAIAYYNSMGYDSVTFKSSDESVVIVNSDGFVTPEGPGTANVTQILTNTHTGKTIKIEYEITVKFELWQSFIWYVLFGYLWY